MKVICPQLQKCLSVCCSALLLAWLPATAAGVEALPLFEDDTILELRLIGPLSTMFKDNKEPRKYLFALESGETEHQVDVRLRGNSRLRVCRFPPLMLDFGQEAPAWSPFAGQGKLKLVTHCKRGEAATLNTLEEYAAYRIFGLISPSAMRVRLLRISYVDSGKKHDGTHYAFVLEPARAIANRLDAKRARISGVRLSQLDHEQAALMYVFQYLIGNTDWSLATADGDENCCHNVELFQRSNALVAVPYDFDLAGLVNAGYARPDPSLRISSVTKRVYRGYCINDEALGNAIDRVVAAQPEILSIVESLPTQSSRELGRQRDFLNQFFKAAKDRDRLLGQFKSRCL